MKSPGPLEEPRTDHQVIASVNLLNHLGNIRGVMLPIAIDLDVNVVPIFFGSVSP